MTGPAAFTVKDFENLLTDHDGIVGELGPQDRDVALREKLVMVIEEMKTARRQRKIITAPATRREQLARLRDIRRLAEKGADPNNDNVAWMKERFQMIVNHCNKARVALEPWRDRKHGRP